MEKKSGGPLTGLRVVEFVGIGPGPHCAMLLADLGAEVLRIDREGGNGWPNPIMDRGRSKISLDIRSRKGRDSAIRATDLADVVIEGFRPGVMERLQLGPEILCSRNERLIYGRVTGWGQTGPLARSAGHDINFIALTGALAAIGPAGRSSMPPLNLVGDFGGGSMLLAFGLLAALWEREQSGRGQIIDAAIIDGVSSMMSMFGGLIPEGRISVEKAQNPLAGAAPFYRCYFCADGREISVGALEPAFYAQLLNLIEAPDDLSTEQYDCTNWDRRTAMLRDLFASRPSSFWRERLEGSDVCFAPVLELDEAPLHPHMHSRQVYTEHEGLLQPSPIPRFSRTPGAIRQCEDGIDLLAQWSAETTGHTLSAKNGRAA